MRASRLLLSKNLRATIPYDPSNTAAVFGDKSTSSLLLCAALFKLCSYRPLVDAASALLASSIPVVSPLARAVVKRTIFPLFVSGESMGACLETSSQLKTFAGVSTILDHNVEERETEDAWEANLANKLTLLQRITEDPSAAAVRFVPLKATALLCPRLLETMSAHMYMQLGGTDRNDLEVLAKLSPAECALLSTGMARLETICQAASRSGRLGILLDAEQSHRQPAIEYIAQQLAAKFNRSAENCLLYNTYQMYTKRSAAALQRDVDAARREGYILGVKLVRGAYIATERRKGRSGGEDPIFSTKAETDANYNATMTGLLEHVRVGRACLLLATHNRQSVDLAVATMDKLGLPSTHPGVSFASIMGMVNNVSNALGLAGYNSNKLVSFGVYDDVLPWLLRRLHENNDAFGAMQLERRLFLKEVKRRIVG